MKSVGKLIEKHKRVLVVSGLAVLCVALIVFIGTRFQTKAQANDMLPSSNTGSAVTPSPDTGSATTTGEKTVVVQANSSASSAVNSQPAQTDQSAQNLQPKVSKPAAPSESEAKNPSKPPSSAGSTSSSKESTSSTPKAGDTQNGKVYVPGFGWVTNNGGGGSGTTVGSSGDQLTGNKVGQMD
jgi:biopolymer transport protein ExbD